MENKLKTRPFHNNTFPSDWEIKKLREVAKVTSGGTPNREKKAFWGGNIPWITTSLIDFNEIESAEQFITEDGLKESSTKLFPSGTLLMALYGQGVTRGKTAILRIEATTNQACAAIILDEKRANKEYVFQYLISKYEDIRRLSNTGNQENLNGELVKSIKLNLPPLPEQIAIANILRLMDSFINKNDQLLSQKELQKKWLMQNLLSGKKRLKGFEGEWKEFHLGEMFSERNEIGYSDLPLLSVGINGIYPQTDSIKRDISNEDKSKYRRIFPGDIGYNTMRMWQGRSALSSLDGIVSPAYTIVIPKKNADSLFFSYLFKTPKMTNLFWRNSQGLVDDTLNCKFKDFSIVKVHLPVKEEQTAIAKVLRAADKEIELLRAKGEKLREQKRGMMQVLLTGRKRLKIN